MHIEAKMVAGKPTLNGVGPRPTCTYELAEGVELLVSSRNLVEIKHPSYPYPMSMQRAVKRRLAWRSDK